MSFKQILAVLILTCLSFLAFGHVENFTFGLIDNAPMLVLMLMGCDPDKGIGARLARFNISPTYLACGVAMIVNTGTDGTAGLVDPDAACLGIIFGCLVPIAFLPVVWLLRSETPAVETPEPEPEPEPQPLKPWATYHAMCALPKGQRKAATIQGIDTVNAAIETASYPENCHFESEKQTLEQCLYICF